MASADTGSRSDWEYARNIRLPFSLTLATGEQIQCQEILRLLPGRRLVGRVELSGRILLLKMFMGKHCRSEAEEDSEGARALARAGIATPALLQESSVAGKDYPVLLFEYLPGTRVFREAWEQASGELQRQLLTDLLVMVGEQHQAGLRQRDFHLRNFLVDDQGALFAIDGGDFAIGPHPLGRRLAFRNLGALFGHLPAEVLRQEHALLERYLASRGWTDKEGAYRVVEKNSIRFRRRRARVISNKAFRDCSEFQARWNGRLRICQRRDFPARELDDWIRRTGLDLEPGAAMMLKDGNSQTVWRTSIAGNQVVVKRYNLKNPVHALRRAITRSRASRAWQNAFRLRAYHIPTPEPLAMIEERSGVFRRRAWLMTRAAPGVGANVYFRERTDGQALDASMVTLAGVVGRFGVNRIAHGDMKATNFILDGTQVQVIDLDSMWQPRLPWRIRGAIAKDRKRFLANWSDPGLKEKFAAMLSAVGKGQ